MSATIKGSAKLVITALGHVPAAVDVACARGLARGLLYAVGLAQRNYLSGPRPQRLDVRTRRLRDSVTAEVEINRTVRALEWLRSGGTSEVRGDGQITGRIGTNVEYAAFHEFGFYGIVHVGAHSRVLSTSDVSGNKIDQRGRFVDRAGNFIGYKSSHGKAAAKSSSKAAFVFQSQVKAYERHVNYAGRPYLRPALEAALPEIKQEVRNELRAISPNSK